MYAYNSGRAPPGSISIPEPVRKVMLKTQNRLLNLEITPALYKEILKGIQYIAFKPNHKISHFLNNYYDLGMDSTEFQLLIAEYAGFQFNELLTCKLMYCITTARYRYFERPIPILTPVWRGGDLRGWLYPRDMLVPVEDTDKVFKNYGELAFYKTGTNKEALQFYNSVYPYDYRIPTFDAVLYINFVTNIPAYTRLYNLKYIFKRWKGQGSCTRLSATAIFSVLLRMNHIQGKDISRMLEVLTELLEEMRSCTFGQTIDKYIFLNTVRTDEYLAAILGADPNEPEHDVHVWYFKEFLVHVTCSACFEEMTVGIVCYKCRMAVHDKCYKIVRVCPLPNYDMLSPTLYHLFSNKLIRGNCEYCHKSFSRSHMGTYCRWCKQEYHTACTFFVSRECTRARFRNLLIPQKSSYTEKEIEQNQFPVLVFVNPNAGKRRGEKLMRDFQKILNPKQVINLLHNDAKVGFQRFKKATYFNVIIVGGDRTITHVLKSYDPFRDQFPSEPRFKFVPMGTVNEAGRYFGGGIRYRNKSAKYLLKQFSRLAPINFDTWQISEEKAYDGITKFDFTFISSFSFGVDAASAIRIANEKKKVPIKFHKKCNTYQYWMTKHIEGFRNTLIDIDDYLIIECDGQLLDLTQDEFLGIAFLNIPTYQGGRRLWQYDPQGAGPTPDLPLGNPEVVLRNQSVNDGRLDVIGLKEYYTFNQEKIRETGVKLAHASMVKILIKKNLPYQVDGVGKFIRSVRPTQLRRMDLRPDTSIKVLVPIRYTKEDGPLLKEGESESDNEDEAKAADEAADEAAGQRDQDENISSDEGATYHESGSSSSSSSAVQPRPAVREIVERVTTV